MRLGLNPFSQTTGGVVFFHLNTSLAGVSFFPEVSLFLMLAAIGILRSERLTLRGLLDTHILRLVFLLPL